ncbi:MAG: menaquinone biosynthesis protein [Bacteroidales bacterium]|nr:menaquinone biosynthesis protein [Bacteroidales bacterium]
MTIKSNISIVSYINTIPLLYGIEQSQELNKIITLSKDYPAECARKITENEVVAGLASVGILSENPDYHIVSDMCIACEGKVDSVLLCSNVPLEKITKIHLDYQSKTSNLLVQILANKFWQIYPAYSTTTIGYEDTISNSEAAVIIGNRAFIYQKKFKYVFDLGLEWYKFKKSPFVFACWFAKKEISPLLKELLDKAQQFGLENINKAINCFQTNLIIDLHEYLSQTIKYNFDSRMRIALNQFLFEIDELKKGEYT